MSPSRKLVSITAGILVLVGVGTLLVGTGYVESVVSSKLVGERTVSRLERLAFALSGLRMFADHPVTGVGISQYGYYYNTYEYLDLGTLSNFFGLKRIANNVYVELLAEVGIVGFLLFGAFLVRVYRHLRAQEMLPLRLGFWAVLLAWNAFPSYSIMFLWAFWGVILGVSARLGEPGTPLPQ
jgi:O-antigen ligase